MPRSKFVGCMVGSAVGDALGHSFEGRWVSEVKVKCFSGRWTDDTHMMIGVAESLIENEGFNRDHMAQTPLARSHKLTFWGRRTRLCRPTPWPSRESRPVVSIGRPFLLEEARGFHAEEVYQERLERVERLLGEGNKQRVVRRLGNRWKPTTPTAICSFLQNPQSFEGALLYAVSLGEDTDTIGAMTGAISGAYHGAEATPEGWKSWLEPRDYIETLAEKLWRIKAAGKSGSE